MPNTKEKWVNYIYIKKEKKINITNAIFSEITKHENNECGIAMFLSFKISKNKLWLLGMYT